MVQRALKGTCTRFELIFCKRMYLKAQISKLKSCYCLYIHALEQILRMLLFVGDKVSYEHVESVYPVCHKLFYQRISNFFT